MGAGVSNWELSRAVSIEGQLGVVSGIAMEIIMARRLQAGDEGGHVRRALAAFPDQAVATRILTEYFRESRLDRALARLPRPHRIVDPDSLVQETIAASFMEIFLAKEGHDHPVGVNLLTKIELPILASLYGAMLAGVDFVIMGAGIPREVPGILDRLSRHEDVSMALHVEGASATDDFRSYLSPRKVLSIPASELKRPSFFPIVSSNVLASTMVRKATGRVDGLVIESPVAGGHNAPPRGELTLDANGEPIYGPKDEVVVERIADLGVPFYLAGGWGRPEKVREALGLGAAGVQVGTVFAFCRESGLMRSLKEMSLVKAARGLGQVFTDVMASPTGFPFKVLSLEGTMSELMEYLRRPRVCDLGFLRHLYKKEDGSVGYRCPAEPAASWTAKGGAPEQQEGRKCLCNGLLANLGWGLERPGGYMEKPLLTVGTYFDQVRQFLRGEGETYSAREVIAYLMRDLTPQT
ncbi:MAG TPA: nitronate monooxygenase [Thermoanaerobaculaceae bacterium]|nr:nitronate monooxygenase [Thermoanaerobaculaceae bacterium]